MRELGQECDFVIDDAERGSMLAQVAQDRAKIGDFCLAQARGGLVEQQKLGLAHHGHGDAEHFLFAVGQAWPRASALPR